MTTSPALISRLEAARMCGVSVDTFDRHVRPQLHERRIGGLVRGRVLFDADEVQRWATGRGEEESSPATGSVQTSAAVPARRPAPRDYAKEAAAGWEGEKRARLERRRERAGTVQTSAPPANDEARAARIAEITERLRRKRQGG